MNFFDYPVCVPFGNTNYDTALGGSHDMDFAAPPNSSVISIVPGVISDISSPKWGKQVGVKMDHSINGHQYFAYLHLSAVDPSLKVEQRIELDHNIGWVGGGTTEEMYQGTKNPTGSNFLDNAFNSSRIQVGIALMDGPSYGGIGWKNFPPIDTSLNPWPVVEAYKARKTTPDIDYKTPQFEAYLQYLMPVNMNTGIIKEYMRQAKSGKRLGPAIAGEMKTDRNGKPVTDWNGDAIIVQFFLYGWIEYHIKSGEAITYFP